MNNPVLINRVVAACTLEVSTTVDSGKFNQVFNWLMREKIIPFTLRVKLKIGIQKINF